MEEENKKFQITVITKLTQLETILQEMDYKKVEEIARDGLNKSCQNEKKISKVENTITWLTEDVAWGGVTIAIVIEAVIRAL